MIHHSPIIEAASWRIATELCRRLPALSIYQYHPGGGLADCLAIMHPERGRLGALNRQGTFHALARLDGQPARDENWPIWDELLRRSSEELVNTVGGELGLPMPKKLPSTRPHVLVYRIIATLLTLQSLARKPWYCVSAFLDSSGYVLDPIEPAIASFAIPHRLIRSGMDGGERVEAVDFWIIFRSDQPVLCLRRTGEAWSTNGMAWKLTAMYEETKRILPIVLALLGKHAD